MYARVHGAPPGPMRLRTPGQTGAIDHQTASGAVIIPTLNEDLIQPYGLVRALTQASQPPEPEGAA